MEVAMPLSFLNPDHYLQLGFHHLLQRDKQDGGGHPPIPLREESKNGGDQPSLFLLKLIFLHKIGREVIISPPPEGRIVRKEVTIPLSVLLKVISLFPLSLN